MTSHLAAQYSKAQRRAAHHLYPRLLELADVSGRLSNGAMRLREAAFHQAGHLWAANLGHAYIGDTALDGSPLSRLATSTSPGNRLWVRDGLLAAALYPIADAALETTGQVSVHQVEEDVVLEQMRRVPGCERFNENALLSRPGEYERLDEILHQMVGDWPRLHELAVRLIDGDCLTDADVAETMRFSIAYDLLEYKTWKDRMDESPYASGTDPSAAASPGLRLVRNSDDF